MTGYLLAFLAVTVHELSHYLVALIAGAQDMTVVLMPYGAVLTAKGELPHFGAVLMAGPFANIVLASFALSACWIFPELYGYFKSFVQANVLLAALNLLPAYPLDGGRLLRFLFPQKWARAVTSAFTLVAGVASLFAFVWFWRVTYLIFALFMILSLLLPLVGRINRCDEKDPLFCLARTDEEGRFRPATVKRNGRTIERLSPDKVASLLLSYPSDTPLGEALRGKIGYK